jgi:hypothetical protein
MPPSSQNVNASRKIVRLGVAVFAVCALYSAGWYYAASKGQDWLTATLKDPGNGMSADCADMNIKGFPFRAGVFCSSASLADASHGISLQTGAVRTMAMVYDPKKIVFEADGPAKATLPGGTTLDIVWNNLRGSLGAQLHGLQHLSSEADQIDAKVSLPIADGATEVKINHGEFYVRQNAGNLDVAALANNNTVETSLFNTPLPEFSVSIDSTLTGLAGLLEGDTLTPGTEIAGAINRFALDLGAGKGFLTISGPFQIASNGLLSGDFEINVENFTKLRASLDTSFPQAAQAIDTASMLLQGLSKDGTNASVRVMVRSGAVFLGVIPLGVIPPL